MHGILPSEIARLVLDYLEASSCSDAARVFLETSPDLQECRRVAASGGRFITRVFGLTLINILHTFCDIYGLVQEKLSKIDNDEQLRHCGDLCEQLRTLIDDCRGQRFFVNINVPAQPTNNITIGSSPIITSSIRKRRCSGSNNREKCNRSSKTNSLSGNENIKSPTLNNENDENLNIKSSSTEQITQAKRARHSKEPPHSSTDLLCDEIPTQCSSTVSESCDGGQQSTPNDENERQSLDKSDKTCAKQNDEIPPSGTVNLGPMKLSTGTDTQELMTYSTAEVQTTPYDIIESEPEITDEPIENLSLLTKELLNRTELQERIAENINKAILPTDGLSLKDLSFSECIAANDCNTSIMTELNNAIKSIVTATETDPVFEKFFDEIFQADIESESQDEDAQRKIIQSDTSPSDGSSGTINEFSKESESEKENNLGNLSPNNKNSQLPVESEVSKVNTEFLSVNSTTMITTTTTTTTTTAKTTTVIDTADNQALEDVNAAAILSIINANNKSSNEVVEETEKSSDKQVNCPEYNLPVTNTTTNTTAAVKSSIPEVNFEQNEQQISREINSEINPVENLSVVPKKTQRKPKVIKQKRKSPLLSTSPQLVSQNTIVPALVFCNENDNIEMLKNHCGVKKSQFIPIAPKIPVASMQSTRPLYLRTVNVARKVSVTNTNITKSKTNKKNCPENVQNPIVPMEKSKEITSEAITLYSMNDNNLTEVVVPASLPSINIDEPSFSSSGLSPFLKFNKKSTQLQPTSVIKSTEKNTTVENVISQTAGCDITKRTPKSLLKSRSMNHRLSLSTPRRRSGHIRALDFNTPPKEINTSRRLSEADATIYPPKSTENSKPICRTSLFKSPPFESSPSDKHKNDEIMNLNKIPSADSSPVPKLYGGWDKVSGVGTILDCTSPTISSSRSTLLKNGSTSESTLQKQQSTIKKSWDADLRKSLDLVDNAEKKPREKLRKRNAKMSAEKIKTTVLPTEKSVKIKKSSISQDKNNQNELSTINESSNSICDIKVLKTNLTVVSKKGATKKYAKLKTLATNIKRIDNNDQNNLLNTNINRELSEKSIESMKNSSHIASELETPRKNENTLGIPPTPRVLSPNSTTPFVQTTEDSGKVRCFITTPEFPPTPCINLTPRQGLENTTDATNDEFSTAYYHPSSELKEISMSQSQNEHDNSNKDSKPEIAQFEVIKENLPKNEACKELNISINNSKDTENSQSIKNIATDRNETFNDLKTNKSWENSGTTLSDSSDSESDTSSSSCSSSSCSCNDDTTNNSSRMSTGRRSKDTPKKIEIHSSMTNSLPKIIDKTCDEKLGNSCERIERQIARVIPLDNVPCDQQEIISRGQNVMWKKNESSPEKVFPIAKTQQALDEVDTETPAKDETLLCEAEISETPCGSKSGMETVTNLASKISALSAAKEPKPRKYHGVLRKFDTKPNVDSAKTNIMTSLNNAEKLNRLGKESTTEKLIEDEIGPSNIVHRTNEESYEKFDETKFINTSDKVKSPLKLQSKPTSQKIEQTSNALCQTKKEMKNSVKENFTKEKNEKEEQTIQKENDKVKENIRNDTKNLIITVPDSSSTDVVIALDSSDEFKSQTSSGISDPQILSVIDNKTEINFTGNPKAELSVLESLKLVPASKIESVENPETNSTKLLQHCHREFSFIHDDTVNTKKRNMKKFTPSDLEFAIQLRNDEFATMTATRFETLFTLPSESVRGRQTRKTKTETKSEVKSCKPTIRSIKTIRGVTITKSKKISPATVVNSQPLATSSPVQIEIIPKITGKIKSSNENNHDVTVKATKNPKEIKKQSMTTRKRKERTESKDEEPPEKKSAVANPSLLLSGLNIHEFLSRVHGPTETTES